MSPLASAPASALDERSRAFYRHALGLLDQNGVGYLVGGAYAFACYTGIERHTKDFDVFIRRSDFDRAAKILEDAGYETDLTFPHWLGKAFKQDDFIDLIFSAGNGVAVVDELWFEHAVPASVLGMDVKLIPPEEMIWSKGLIMERERYDGADVAHVIRAAGESLDWSRLIERYGRYWRALYAHLILFGFIYPSDRSKVPTWVMDKLEQRLAKEVRSPDAKEKICYGTIISRQQYLIDLDRWGYKDARLEPLGNMTAEEIAHWTAGIAEDGHK
jgi:putative nucleotidyltransferase-like protein